MTDKSASYVIRKADQQANAFSFRHPLGEGASEIIMTMLAQMAGLKRVGVNLGRVPPDKEAFVYHRHHAEEEWVYILEGKALSDIDDIQQEVRAGDFIAYPEGVAHTLKNIGDSDLVYLMGGEQTAMEIADFPRHGKRVLRTGERMEFVDEDAMEPFIPDIRPVSPKKP
ncbi:MAG: cupin domain-containing protein [Pseudomonadota bacterium]